MLNWIKGQTQKTSAAEAVEGPSNVQPVNASKYEQIDISDVLWDTDHNSDRLTVSGEGLTIEWDENKDNEGESTPCWIPASKL